MTVEKMPVDEVECYDHLIKSPYINYP